MINILFPKRNKLEECLLSSIFDEKCANMLKKKKYSYELTNFDGGILHKCASKNRVKAIEWLISNKYIDKNILNNERENALFTAIRHKSNDAALYLIQNGINIEQTNIYGRNVISEALKYGIAEVVNALINADAKLHGKDTKGRNILFNIIKSYNKEYIFEILHITKLDINSKDVNGENIGFLIETSNDVDIFKRLIIEGLDLNIKNHKGISFLYNFCDNLIVSEEIFTIAIRSGINMDKTYGRNNDSILVKILNKLSRTNSIAEQNKYKARLIFFIRNGASVDTDDIRKETLLNRATEYGNIDILKYILCETNIDVNQKNINGLTVFDLYILSGKKNESIIRLLLNNGANPLSIDNANKCILDKLIDKIMKERKIILREAEIDLDRENDSCMILKYISKIKTVNINNTDELKEPLFFKVARSFDIKLLKFLKSIGIRLDKQNNNKINVLQMLLKENSYNSKHQSVKFYKTLEYLTFNQVCIENKDEEGNNSIHNALLYHCNKTTMILLRRTNNFSSKDKNGRNYIHTCVWSNNLSLIRFFMSKDENMINGPDKYGILPLNYAAIIGRKEIVLEMISRGAYLNNNNKINKDYVKYITRNFSLTSNIERKSFTSNDKFFIDKLVNNMKKEFKV